MQIQGHMEGQKRLLFPIMSALFIPLEKLLRSYVITLTVSRMMIVI